MSKHNQSTDKTDLPERGGLVEADAVPLADGHDDAGAQGHVVAAVHLREEMVHRLQVERNAEVLPEPVPRAPVQRGGHLVRRPVPRRCNNPHLGKSRRA